MSIVLNELTWVEDVLRTRELGKRPYETLMRVAKYYTYQGLTKKKVRAKLDEFLLSCDPTASLVAWTDTLDSAAKYAANHRLIIIDGIDVSSTELAKIDALDSVMARRLAFTLLCVAKYFYAVSEKTGYWVATPDSEIMRMANINQSIKRQSAIYTQLRDAGMIRFSRKIDNLSVQVLFVDNSDTAIHITDFRNLGYQYAMIHGGPYFICENCGITAKRSEKNMVTGRPSKYCSECAVKVKMKGSIDAVMRKRSK